MKDKDIQKQKEILLERAREEASKWQCPECKCLMSECGSATVKVKNDHGKKESISGDYCQCCYLHWMTKQIPKFVKRTIIT